LAKPTQMIRVAELLATITLNDDNKSSIHSVLSDRTNLT